MAMRITAAAKARPSAVFPSITSPCTCCRPWTRRQPTESSTYNLLLLCGSLLCGSLLRRKTRRWPPRTNLCCGPVPGGQERPPHTPLRPKLVDCLALEARVSMKLRKLLLFLLFAATLSLYAQDIASFEKRIQVRTLPNGLTVILMQRTEAPVFSFYTFVDAGSAQDPKGQTGLAHMFEHMAFKGTQTIGTTNYPAEKEVLAKIETVYAQYVTERDRRVNHDDAKVAALEK